MPDPTLSEAIQEAYAHAPSDAYAEECRAWGRAQKAALGL